MQGVRFDGADEGAERPFIAAAEGYYGPPLTPDARRALIGDLATYGYDAYLYAPKDDPFQRASWRDRYPTETLAPILDLVDACVDHGLVAGLTVSPGLDWQVGDPTEVDALVAKVEQLLGAGAGWMAIQWDDVPGGGAELGAAVAQVVERLGDGASRWLTCPVDYAVDSPTPYLTAFSEAVGDGVDVMWTGPSVLSAHIDADDVDRVARPLGRRLCLAENYPVNDLGMAGVLHLGPYPDRSRDAMGLMSGVLANFMSLPRASRLGLSLVARAWRHPGGDREEAWRDAIAEQPPLAPLARGCRAWLDDPGPDADLVAWADAAPADSRLVDFLAAGCRAGLDEELAAEVAPWLDAWDREAALMQHAISILAAGGSPPFTQVAALAVQWRRARAERHQVFGTRFAIYPATRCENGDFHALAGAVVDAANLTDRLVRRALGHR